MPNYEGIMKFVREFVVFKLKVIGLLFMSVFAVCFVETRAGKLRDPFFPVVEEPKNPSRSSENFNDDLLSLVGTVCAQKRVGAIVDFNGNQQLVFEKDWLGGIKIEKIRRDSIDVNDGKSVITLVVNKNNEESKI